MTDNMDKIPCTIPNLISNVRFIGRYSFYRLQVLVGLINSIVPELFLKAINGPFAPVDMSLQCASDSDNIILDREMSLMQLQKRKKHPFIGLSLLRKQRQINKNAFIDLS